MALVRLTGHAHFPHVMYENTDKAKTEKSATLKKILTETTDVSKFVCVCIINLPGVQTTQQK